MALAKCPHMSARCPHYQSACDHPDSKNCFYVKSTTSTALVNLRYLLDAAKTSGHDAKLQQRIDELRRFLQNSQV